MNSVVHFELPADDRDRMVKFYSETFGWKAQMFGPEMGSYVVVQTGETDENNMLKEPGRINGGLTPRKADGLQAPSFAIEVEDIKKHIEMVKAGGGTVLGEPVEIPGVGWYVVFIDTENNKLSMLQPTRK